MRVGFTGTQQGMTDKQKETFEKWLGFTPMHEFHHGDCIGADSDAHNIVRRVKPDVQIILHPPIDSKKRAWCKEATLNPPKPYIERNHTIVEASSVLVACPKLGVQEIRSGTWSTIRYAEKNGVMVLVIWPDGKMERWC